MNKLFTKLFTLCVILSSCFTALAYEIEVDGIYYYFYSLSDSSCRVTSGEKKYTGNIVIPAQIQYNNKSLDVIGIGYGAFRGCSSLESVVIPNSVTGIGSYAFEDCSSLQSVEIPNSVTSIYDYAFSGCSSLQSIDIPNSVISIGERAFRDCSSLQSVVIPNSITKIDSYVFSGCSSLQSIVIPNSVTSIGYNAFASCSSLQSAVIPNSVTYLSGFSGCSSLQSIEIPNSVTSIGYSAFTGCSSLESIEIPNSVTTIGEEAFRNCQNLKSIKLSENLEKISFGLIRGCTSLSSLTIPKAIKYIVQEWYNKDTGFECHWLYGCINLKSMFFEFNSHELVFTERDKTAAIAIDDWTNQLEKIYLDRELTENITNLDSLKELIIGENCDNVCAAIKYAPNLTNISSYAIIPPTIPAAANRQYLNVEVVVPVGTLEDYQNADVWKNFRNIREMDQEEAEIDDIITDEHKKETARYNLQGKEVNGDYKGLVIIRYSDGTSRKVINK
ncbi:MAG: leucine-rich repeat domain-containing protein [Duncaniella sp.]|nr:leucine-rich repeat domain-containing protein [Duncaniella sp.]